MRSSGNIVNNNTIGTITSGTSTTTIPTLRPRGLNNLLVICLYVPDTTHGVTSITGGPTAQVIAGADDVVNTGLNQHVILSYCAVNQLAQVNFTVNWTGTLTGGNGEYAVFEFEAPLGGQRPSGSFLSPNSQWLYTHIGGDNGSINRGTPNTFKVANSWTQPASGREHFLFFAYTAYNASLSNNPVPSDVGLLQPPSNNLITYYFGDFEPGATYPDFTNQVATAPANICSASGMFSLPQQVQRPKIMRPQLWVPGSAR